MLDSKFPNEIFIIYRMLSYWFCVIFHQFLQRTLPKFCGFHITSRRFWIEIKGLVLNRIFGRFLLLIPSPAIIEVYDRYPNSKVLWEPDADTWAGQFTYPEDTSQGCVPRACPEGATRGHNPRVWIELIMYLHWVFITNLRIRVLGSKSVFGNLKTG